MIVCGAWPIRLGALCWSASVVSGLNGAEEALRLLIRLSVQFPWQRRQHCSNSHNAALVRPR